LAQGDDRLMLRSARQTTPEPCRAAVVVLDFDGTLTDADAHAAAFHEASGRELARRLGWDEPTLRRERQRALAAAVCLPATAAWTVDGYGVCPATADPYLIANTVTKMLIAARRPELDDAALVASVLEAHHAAYASAPPPFRPDARSLLEELSRRDLHVRVVTNSHTQIVTRLLDSLSFRGRAKVTVQGGANKFLVCGTAVADARFESLPETAEWPEVDRPVYLRRGRYFDLLRRTWDETGTGPDSTLVAGDIFELDLAMPAALGTHVHLATRASTMPHEIRLARKLARGDAAAPLSAILARIRG
jgi:beta-phosphoglucomutase-like phosphatase (HAD superfamily)